ncbi:hypothetical protein K2Y11_17855 [bacterium]|nr:hypothetical protein [bacterium]
MDRRALTESILGYLDFSDGAPSASFHQALNEFYRSCAADTDSDTLPPWLRLREELSETANTTSRFGPLKQARGVFSIVHDSLLPAYRQYHRDLLAHLTDTELFVPFFLARCYEAVLAQREPWTETSRIVAGAIDRLNDFVGHRPVPVLENHRGIQPYPHERVRPIPIFIRGAGVSVGAYESLLKKTLSILEMASDDVLEAASMDLSLLDELAIDPRAYDHAHPSNQRPGYQFGEWDPQHIDNQGRYRRFVLRLMILDALVAWQSAPANEDRQKEAEFEASAALAGTMLLASGVSGRGPGAFSSDMSLAKLVPGVAAYRDAFYSYLLEHITGEEGDHLRDEAKRLRQPFGGVRSFLNQYVARCKADQIERDRLSLLFARMGFAEASRDQAARIDIPSTRMRADIECLLVSSDKDALVGHVKSATKRIEEAEDVLHRAIECGAMIDPWNILGFQGNFNRFQAVEDAVTDHRVDILLQTMQKLFESYALALREGAAAGDVATTELLRERLNTLVEWWDQFATTEVSGLRRVSGRDSMQSANFVAQALSQWRQSGQQTGDVAFWRERSEHFSSTQSFGLVVEALLEKHDYVSAMALLMQWLSDSEDYPLDEAGHSFHELVLRWMAGMMNYVLSGEPVPTKPGGRAPEASEMIVKFFDFLEANAGELWSAPSIDRAHSRDDDDDEEDIFAAAYEGVTYQDKTDDGVDASLAGEGPSEDEGIFATIDDLMRRLRFLGTVARLWYLAAHPTLLETGPGRDRLQQWILRAIRNKRDLSRLLRDLDEQAIAAPSGNRDSLLDFERRSSIKETLIIKASHVAIEMSHALRVLLAIRSHGETPADLPSGLASWEPSVIAFESALRHGDAFSARQRLSEVRLSIADAQLMYVPTDKGGKPLDVYAARYARDVLRSLVVQLPAIGDFQGVYDLMESVLDIEHEQSSRAVSMQVSEFDLLFRIGYRSLMVKLVDLLGTWEQTRSDNERSTGIVGQVVSHFSHLWSRYISNVRISELERRRTPRQWKQTEEFIASYGRGIFTQAFMTEGSLRGILHHGPASYLTDLLAGDTDEEPTTLLRALTSGELSIDKAAEEIDFIARSVLENYDVYRDYNTTTPQSDYGENLQLLMELLRRKTEYERHRWALEPAYIAHNILVRKGRFEWAALVREAFVRETRSTAEMIISGLAETEKKCGFHLQTVRSRINEGFVGQLRLDEVLGLAERSLSEDSADSGNAFDSLLKDVEEFCDLHQGSGIDLPEWLRQLENTVDRVLDEKEGRLLDFEELAAGRLHAVELPFEDFERQTEKWEA